MKTNVIEKGQWARELEVEVEAVRIDRELDKALRKYQKRLELPGFRKGKVPFNMVKSRFGDSIRGEVLGDLLPSLLEEATREAGLVPAAPPQISQLDTFVTHKRNLADYYRNWFRKWSDASFVLEPTEARSNYWLNAILLPDHCARDEFLARTNERGVMTRPMWTPMNTLPMYRGCQQFNLVNSPRIEARLVNIPSSAVSLN